MARKFRIIAAVLLLVTFTVPLTPAQGSRAQAEITLRQLEQDIVMAGMHNDWRLWNQVVAPDWTMIDRFGQQWDKPGALARIKEASAKGATLQDARLYDVQVRFVRDDIAIITGTLTVIASASHKTVKLTDRATDIFVLTNGKWLVVASQTTPIATSVR